MAKAVAGIKRERNSRVFLILAGVCGIAFAVLAFVALNRGGDGGGKAGAGDVEVVVAAQNLPAGTQLTQDELKVISVASDVKLEGSYAATGPLVGQITRYPVLAGEQITLAKIGVAAGEREDLSFIIPPGKRAMAVSVTQVSAVGGLVLPGDRVDLIAVTTDANGSGQRVTTLFQNVEVLAVAQAAAERLPAPPPSAAETDEEAETADELTLAQRPADAEPQPNATTVTLALTPEQTEELSVVQETRRIWLVLRPFGAVDVVVAGQDIPGGTEITEEMLKVAPVEPEALLDGTYTEIAPLVGVVAPGDIAAGGQVTAGKLGLVEEDKDGLSFVVPPGKRALSVAVTQQVGVGGLVRTGDRVDVIAVYGDKAVTLFQNVEVLAVDQVTKDSAAETANSEERLAQTQNPQDPEPQPQATTVTLALEPAQAQLLALAQSGSGGQEQQAVWLSLRGRGDDAAVDMGPAVLP